MTYKNKGIYLYSVSDDEEVKVDNAELIASIFLELTSRYPLWRGIHLLFKAQYSMDEIWQMELEDIATVWFESLPTFVKKSFMVWMIDLNNKLVAKKIDVSQNSAVESFVLGDLSKTLVTPKSGSWSWEKLLPKDNLSLFKSIAVNWRKKALVLQQWLYQLPR